MRKSMKQTAAAVMALISLASMKPIPQSQQGSSEQTQASRKGKEQTPPVTVTHQQQIIQSAGGLNVIKHGRDGIPPHIYGTYHVRKGTHKRSNK